MIRYAVVGAGWISQEAFMPGVAQSGNSTIAAIVTGDLEKGAKLAAFHNVPQVVSYSDYDALLASGTIDANGFRYGPGSLVVPYLKTAEPAIARIARELRRFFFSGAAESNVDRQGRILVPAVLTRHAGLERDVIVAGNYDHLELWQPAAWEQHLHAVEGSAEHAAERLAAHGS